MRPEPAREPRVEHVFVLHDGAAAVGACGEILAAREHVVGRVAVAAVPHRHAMSPPELARDVPVANVGRASSRRRRCGARGGCAADRCARLPAPARRAAACARTTGRRGVARRRCRSGSSAARCGRAVPSSRGGQPLPAVRRSACARRIGPCRAARRARDRLRQRLLPCCRTGRSPPASAGRAACRPRSRSHRAPA